MYRSNAPGWWGLLLAATIGSANGFAAETEADFPRDGLVLWVNAGNVKVHDSTVETLTDLSGKGNHARRMTDRSDVRSNPQVVAKAFNGQPVLRFSGEHAAFEFPRIADIRTVFWVVRKDRSAFQTYVERFVLGDRESRDFHPGTHFTDGILCGGRDPLAGGSAWINGQKIDAAKTDFPGDLGLITLIASENVRANLIARDREFADRCWKGDIAEILLFNRALDDDHRLAVEKYLTGKYNLPTRLPDKVRPTDHLFFKGRSGPGSGQRIVFVTGDDEYRSEESMPLMARILAERHGFDCTVLFAQNKKTGEIDPGERDNIPGLDALRYASLMVVFTRFRALPNDQMKHIVEYLSSNKPVIGLRTATHAFAWPADTDSTYKKFAWNYQGADFAGGFGKQVLGQTWVNHWGAHGKQSTRGRFAPDAGKHPILRGIADGEIWGPTDVYEATLPLPEGCKPILLGQVLKGMKSDDPAVDQPELDVRTKKMVHKNEPMMPIAWIYERPIHPKRRTFTSTIGGAMSGGSDFANEGMRRMFVNACYWCCRLEDKIPEKRM